MIMESNPICECMTIEVPIRASRTGVLVPVTNGVTTRGTSATESARSKVQWYDPCDLCGSGIGTGSLTVPLMTSVMLDSVEKGNWIGKGEIRGPAGRILAGLVWWKRSGRTRWSDTI